MTWSQSAAVPAPQQKMFGARLWIFSQFLSPTMLPPVARVSAARATPSWTRNTHQYSDIGLWRTTYIEDDSTDGGTSLSEWELLSCGEISFKGFVSKAVVVVESSERECIHVVQFHLQSFHFKLIKELEILWALINYFTQLFIIIY